MKKRFVTEYANWKWKVIEECSESEANKNDRLKELAKIVWDCEQGLVLIDEAMKKIAEL